MNVKEAAVSVGLMTAERELIHQLQRFTHFRSTLHGPAHWVRVHRFGLLLGDGLNFDDRQVRCIEVFGWTHDLARVDDGGGNQHALDGADHAFAVMDALFPDLGSSQQALVSKAIRYHSDGMTAAEAYYQGLLDLDEWTEDEIIDTVGACWDADRLDLLRLGIAPNQRYMSTECWLEVLPYSQKLHRQRQQGEIRRGRRFALSRAPSPLAPLPRGERGMVVGA